MRITRRLIRDKKYRNLILRRFSEEALRAAMPVNIATRLAPADQEFLKTLRIGFVGGCELLFMKEFLEANGAQCYLTFDYSEASNPILVLGDQTSGIYSFEPSVVVISDVQQVRNYISEIQDGGTTFERQEEQLTEAKTRLLDSIRFARQELSATYVILNYPLAIRPAHGRFDYKNLSGAYSLREFLNRLDVVYYQLSKENNDIYMLSHNDAFLNNGVGYQIREIDADGIYEHITREGAVTVALDLINHLKVIKGHGRRIKCAVVDLDNTLWDGVLRDDGIEGINLHFSRLKVLELLTKRGIILAIVSKNDSTLVPLVNQLLGRYADFFVIKKINWNDKAQNLQEISQELNIGIESLAFFDDNPYERDQIKAFLPQVLILSDTEILHSLNRIEFEPIGKLTNESSERVSMYLQQKQRVEAEKLHYDKDAFLRSCNMEIWMRKAEPENMGRVTELIQRTNQLNATAVRYSREELLDFFRSSDYHIYVVDLYDRYGEYGLIGVSLINEVDSKWIMEILTFSCRAMGKTVEQTFLTYLMHEASERKIQVLIGKYNKTDRNEAIERIFLESSFDKTSSKHDVGFWEYDIEKKGIPEYPDWFSILDHGK